MKIDFQDRGLSFDHVNSNDTHMFVYRLHPDNGDSSTGHAEQKLLSDHLHQALHKILSSETQSFHKIYPGRAYLDIDCVPCLAAQETRASRARYLWNCSVFVPVITWGQEHSVLEELAGLDEEHDRESDFLVHALAAIFLLNKDAGRLKAVLPILRDESAGRTSLARMSERLSKKPSAMSCERAAEVLVQAGVRREREAIRQYLLRVSVRDAVAMLLPAFRGAEGTQEEGGRAVGSKGLRGMYVASEKDEDSSAREAGEAIAGCLTKVVREHVDRKLWEFCNHNPRGMELLQMMRESGLQGRVPELLALRGIETIHKLRKHAEGSFRHLGCSAVAHSCDEVLATLEQQSDNSIRRLLQLLEEHRGDERFLPLNERLRRYRDMDVDGILALRTSNSLETALLQLPARSCVVFLSLVYLVFGVKQVGLLRTAEVWLPGKSSSMPVEPRVVRVSVVADPVISFSWSFFFLSSILVAQLSSPLAARRLLLATGHMVIAGNVLCFVADSVQCSVEGTGIGPVCNSNMKLVAIILLLVVMYLAHFLQHYFWLSAFFVQGAYCVFVGVSATGLLEGSLFLLLGVGCCLLGLLIVLRYQAAYRKTLRELRVAMQSFEETWRKVEEEKAAVVEEISAVSSAIAEELEQEIKAEVKTWRQYLLVALGLKERRYSRRNGKIRQVSRDFEQLFLQAQEVSAHFQLWVSSWNQVGRVEHGNVKSCGRAMQKTVRSYNRDPSCLTDLVRCTIVVQSMDEVLAWVTSLCDQSVVGFEVNAWEGPGSSRVSSEDIEAGGDGLREDIYMSITSIKNRYDPAYNASISGGYRDLCVCVEVGWTLDEMSQSCSFVPVKEWGQTAGLRKHICEIQVVPE
uniref:Uncharacterized protein n=1 Tax=Hanusia phi TaxID=3032 RepID=A0A7S0EMU0_9CRYP|mmetsp:Transcript_25759/g.57940  ORF Transcript_25759/g.57940 Transcript_25759/m.57940 type:complete len:859 (+) Transcript_25759:229-2805(+)